MFPHPPDLPLCPRELAECRKTQQEENTDESRSRVQLASIEAKHVSGGLGTSSSHPHALLQPGKLQGCSCAGESWETLGHSMA